MGNRTDQERIPPFINPASSPYLHIVRNAESEDYRYIANLASAVVKVGHYDQGQESWSTEHFDKSFVQLDTLAIPFLNPFTEAPPPEIPTQGLIEERVETVREQIRALITPDVNSVRVSHGSAWWLRPEENIAEILRQEGYDVSSSFPRVGGRKRIQEHAVLINKPTKVWTFSTPQNVGNSSTWLQRLASRRAKL